jgi:hypothetical protein
VGAWALTNGIWLRSPAPTGDAGLKIQQSLVELQETSDIAQSIAKDLLNAASVTLTTSTVLSVSATGAFGGYYTGSYSGWVWEIGAQQNFDRLGVYVFPFDLSYIPTQIRVVVATDAALTTILAEQTVTVSWLPSAMYVGQLVTVDLDHLVVNSEAATLYLAMISNGSLGFTPGGGTSGATYYATNRSLTSPSWSVGTSGSPPQLTLYRVTRTSARMGGSGGVKTALVNAIRQELARAALTVPSYLFAATGREINVYWDGVLRSGVEQDLQYDITCSFGSQQAERWTYTAADSDVTSGNIRDVSFALSVAHGETTLTSASSTLRIAKSPAGTGVTRKVMMLGDSTGSWWLPELVNLFDGDAMAITTVGTRRLIYADADGTSRTTYHEAEAGYRWSLWYGTHLYESGDASSQLSGWNLTGLTAASSNYSRLYYRLTDTAGTRLVEVFNSSGGAAGNRICYGSRSGDGVVALGPDNSSGVSGSVTVAYTVDDTDLASNTLIVNNFLNSGTWDFGQYLTDSSISLSADDWVLIHLGLNDVFSYTTDADLAAAISTIEGYMHSMIGGAIAYRGQVGTDSPESTTIRGAVSGIRVGILLPIPPVTSQDGFGYVYYNSYSRHRYRRNNQLYREWLISKFDNAAMRAMGIYVVPVHANMDMTNNVSNEDVAVNARNSAVTKTRITNDRHPALSGYYQMADAVYSFLKGHET